MLKQEIEIEPIVPIKKPANNNNKAEVNGKSRINVII